MLEPADFHKGVGVDMNTVEAMVKEFEERTDVVRKTVSSASLNGDWIIRSIMQSVIQSVSQ